LDTYMGQMTPHAARSALIARFLTAPLLDLASIGVYALCQAELGPPNAPLAAAGLVVEGRARPLPDRAQVLAGVSQPAAADPNAPKLTEAGWRQLGVSVPHPYPDSSQLLFFAPREVIGPVIGSLIGRGITENGPVKDPSVQATSDETPPEQ